MKKKILSLILVIAILLPVINITALAASEPTITSHKNGKSYAADEFYIKWNAVDGAKRYRLAVKSLNDGSYAADIWWDDKLTKTKYECDEDDIKPGHRYKIWVGACGSSHDDVISQYSIEVTAKAVCDHADYEDYYDYTEYEQINGDNNYHRTVYYYERICDDCDEVIKTDIEGESDKEKHNFSPLNVCLLCGYKGVCSHAYYDDYYDYTDYEQINGDNNYHFAVNYYERICDDCDKTIKTDVKGEMQKESHSYSGNKCTICNYVNYEAERIEAERKEQEEAERIEAERKAQEEAERRDTEKPIVYKFACDVGSSVNRDEVTKIKFTAAARDNVGVECLTLSNGVALDCEYDDEITASVLTDGLRLGKNEFYIMAEDEAGNIGYSESIYITITEDDDESFVDTPQYGKGDTEDDGTWYESVSDIHNKAYRKAELYGGIKVYVNGSKVHFDVEPRLINNRTMVPLRAIFEALGAKVEWNDATQTVTAYDNDFWVQLRIGDNQMCCAQPNAAYQRYVTLDSPAVEIDGRTLVPVRAISEAFNCSVEWFDDKELVSVVPWN